MYAPGVENVIYGLKLLGIIACMTAVVPLMIWGMSGSLKAGLQAWRAYLIAMGWLCVPVLALAVITSVIPH